MVPNILVNKFISEIYPYSEKEINTYREKIDFEYLSKNINLKWSYELVKRFEDLWDWKSLDQNQAVFSKLSLGLLFPGRISLSNCTCFRQMDFCEGEKCSHNIKKFLDATSLNDDFPRLFFSMRMFLESGAVDAKMISRYYSSESPEEVIKLDFELF
ncbi:hypothetical protein [Gramella sp. KN1008]|uniref:hypothetical protein n=1 Tax=Gramella sp. KN1008 TaxID=2529298 RepID=UPI0010394F94|nr:hypothetical protein [Gramella sp. KN1008]TBW26972.1 hypothetical protein EZJ28_11675 [Gramella sp. KN1008]